jgi:predicted RNA-binding protein with PUA domain
VKAGKVFDVDYWCENCQLAATEPGKCKCCGADVVLRELPAK